MVKVLAFSGSARKASFNQAVAAVAANGAKLAGAEVTLINLGDYPMPIFNEDDESANGMPEKAEEFKRLLLGHDAFIIVSPEYNSSYPALLKNAIDWASRMQEGEKPLQAYKGKPGFSGGAGRYQAWPSRAIEPRAIRRHQCHFSSIRR